MTTIWAEWFKQNRMHYAEEKELMSLKTETPYLPREVYRGKWIVIHQCYRPANRKTHKYEVFSTSGYMLGEIKWYGPWRQYALFPESNTVWAGSCFRDVQRFINSLKDTKQKVKP